VSQVQHNEARRLLPIIFKSMRNNRLLTYTTAAKELGRDPKTNPRMVAQVCDLLDAAAALAGVPLLALVAVREISGDINRKAFAGSEFRDAILHKSLHYQFREQDVRSISSALDRLRGKGNRKAWKWVRQQIPRHRLHQPLISADVPAVLSNDAIDDVGSDRPARVAYHGMRYARDAAIRDAVIRRANGKCELCGKIGFLCRGGDRYLEAHHIIALANDGADKLTNVIALCPDEHRQAHFGRLSRQLEKRMIRRLKTLEKRSNAIA
jgi:5-methylcytosine-specific restriction endonuclease McrA